MKPQRKNRPLLSLALLILFAVVEPRNGTAAMVWAVGDQVDGWTITEIVRHPVYMRLLFAKGGEDTSVELLEHHDGPGKWATESFKVQPSPGHQPPESLLRAVLDIVATAEAEGSPIAVLAEPGEGPTGGPPCPWTLAFIGLITCVASVGTATYALRRRRALRSGQDPPRVRPLIRGHIMALIVSLPGFLLALVVMDIGIWVVDLRSVDAEAVRSFIRHHKDALKVQEEESFSFAATEAGLTWSNSGDYPGGDLDLTGADHLILAFGGSSLVISEEDADGINFCSILQGRLDEHRNGVWRIANLGVPGLNSTAVRDRVQASLDQISPALIVIYSGHNDNMVYPHFTSRNLLLEDRRPYLKGMIQLVWTINFWATAGPTWSPGYPVDAEPRLLRLLQRSGVVDLSDLPFDELRTMIFETYEANLRSIVAMARSKGVPVLLVTTVAPLQFPPLGVSGEGQEAWDRAMEETDYEARISGLREAKDVDYLRTFVTSKTEQNDLIRSLAGPGVHVLDLEAWLMSQEYAFELSRTEFLDECHFTSALHGVVAERIEEILVAEHVCCGL